MSDAARCDSMSIMAVEVVAVVEAVGSSLNMPPLLPPLPVDTELLMVM